MREVELDAVPATRSGACRTAAADELLPAGRPRRASRGSRASSCAGRRARRPAAAAAPPPGSSGTGSTQIDAPYSETTRSNGRVGQAGLGRVRLDQRELEPELLLHLARRLELRRRDVDADRPGAARRASQAETYAVPQPSSTTSLPVELRQHAHARPRGSPQIPQVISSAAQCSRALAPVCSAFDFVQSSRLRAASSRRAHRRRTRARSRAAPTRANRSRGSRLFGIDVARSPRIVPGSASAGFVAPIVFRIVAIAPSPSTTSAQRRRRGDERRRARRRRASRCARRSARRRGRGRRGGACRRRRGSRGARSARGSRRRARARSRPA